MKQFCETLGIWLYHPVDISLICQNRALKFSECRRCQGLESPKMKPVHQKEAISRAITLDVDRDEWIEAVSEIRDQYRIHEGKARDEMSSRRIAILLSELYLSKFANGNPKAIFNVSILEKNFFFLAMECRVKCDPLDCEERMKSKDHRKQTLLTWGIDKASGGDGYTSQLKEWTGTALLGSFKTTEKEGDHGIQSEHQPTDSGGETLQGIGSFERDAICVEIERVSVF